MPKVAYTEFTAITSTSIQSALLPADFVLSGRVNKSNLLDENNQGLPIPGKLIEDMADGNRPVDTIKFFGHDPSIGSPIKTQVLDPLITKLNESKQYTVVTGEKKFFFNIDNPKPDSTLLIINKAESYVPIEDANGNVKVFGNVSFDRHFEGELYVSKTVSGSDLVVIDQSGDPPPEDRGYGIGQQPGDAHNEVHDKVNSPHVVYTDTPLVRDYNLEYNNSEIKIDIPINFNDVTFTGEEYISLYYKFYVLCEVKR
jgi:hypothetical protein